MKLKKELIPYLFYSLIIIIFELNIFYNYEYYNINLISFSTSFFIIGFIIIKEYQKNNSFFSLNIIFNLFGLLYTNYHIVQMVMSNNEITSDIYFSMNLSYISIVFFNIGYLISKTIKDENKERKIYNSNLVMIMTFLLFVISIIAEIYVIYYKIGIRNYINVSRAAQSLLMADYSLLSFYRRTIPLVSMISLFIFLKDKNKISKYLFLISFIISIYNSIISVSRAELLSIILPILFILNYYNKISNKKVIILGMIFFIIFGAWKGLVNGKTNVITYDSEFNSWYNICENVLADKDNIDYLRGSSYMKAIVNLIIPVTHTTSLSTWYVKKYEYSLYIMGGGRGFPGILEAYLNFNIIGNMFIYYFYGWLLKKINKNSDLSIIIYCIIMTSIYQMFRSESYSMFKTMMWFKIYPTILIFLISGINKKRRKEEVGRLKKC